MNGYNEIGSTSCRHRVLIEARSPYFQLVEPGVRNVEDIEPWQGGLLKIRPGRIRCLTGSRVTDASVSVASVSVEIFVESPEGALDDCDDVIEESYQSPRGHLSVVDCRNRLVHELPALPAGPASYRLRYHLRNQAPNRVGEYLLQIWAAEVAPSAALKITSSLGNLWHSAA
ncbi:hypothetical protein [Amycolatopsis sp. NPDC049868]|uniref:hypothetical protein n=1 Tax=Amycolatopsis sp. NPDC049868 TaxID=3363934 RepID=UPI0037A8EB6E